MSVIELGNAVIARIGLQRLVELTQEDGTQVVIDFDVLHAACSDSLGEFERIVGTPGDTSNISHVSILVQGVIFFLEDYKARDGGIMTSHGKRFYASCQSLAERRYVDPATNSVLSQPQERAGGISDFSRSSSVWKFGRKGQRISDNAEI